MSTSVTINRSDLDPTVLDLGLVTGLLTDGGGGDEVDLNSGWFDDPFSYLERIPNSPEFFPLLASLLGSLGGDALGTVKQTADRSWYPLNIPGEGANGPPTASGFYLVTNKVPSNGKGNGNSTGVIAGLGAIRTFVEQGVSITPYALFPLVKIPSEDATQKDASFVLGQEPIEIGIDVSAASGAFSFGGGKGAVATASLDGDKVGTSVKIDAPGSGYNAQTEVYFVGGGGSGACGKVSVDEGEVTGVRVTSQGSGYTRAPDVVFVDGVSFDGLKIDVTIPFEGSPPKIGFDIVLLNLAVPGGPPANRSLVELIANAEQEVEEWLRIVLSILGAQLAKQNSQAGAMFENVMRLLGIVGDVPPIDWKRLIEEAKSGNGDPAQVFVEWLRAVVGSDTAAESWLDDCYALLHPAADTSDAVSGSGTLSEPWKICLYDLADRASLFFTLAAHNTGNTNSSSKSKVRAVAPDELADGAPSGTLQVYPGLEIRSDAKTMVASYVSASLDCSLQFLQLDLPASGEVPAPVSFPAFDLMLAFTNPSADDLPLIHFGTGADATFEVDSIEVGFGLSKLRGALTPNPCIRLVGVKTPYGSWPELNLSDFNAKAVKDELASILQKEIEKLLGVDSNDGTVDPSANAFAQHLAAVIGVIAPPSYPGGSGPWPLSDGKMLLSAEELGLLVHEPFGAVGAYYSRCLAPPQGGGVWQYILIELARLFGSSSSKLVNPAAAGNATDPWRVVLVATSSGDPEVVVEAWQPEGTTHELILAFAVDIPLPLPPEVASDAEATLSFVLELLHVTLPDGSGKGPVSADWLRGAGAELVVSGPGGASLTLPDLAGVQISIADVKLYAGWQKSGELGWEATIDSLTLSADGHEVGKVPHISFGSTTSNWQSDLEKLAPLALNVLGVLALEHGGRPGVAASALLGALPNAPSLIDGSDDSPFMLPKGLKLPTTWPALELSHPTQPWLDLQAQLQGLLGDGAAMEAAMRLIGWAITGQVPTAPATQPTGDRNDPWSVLLPDVWDVSLLAWSEDQKQMGLGLERVMASEVSGDIEVAVEMRLDVPAFPLPGGSFGNVAPAISVSVDLRNPSQGKALLDLPSGLRIERARIGASAQLSTSGVSYAPTVDLYGARLTSQHSPATVHLSPVPGTPKFTCEQGMQVIGTLLAALMQEVSHAATSLPKLQAALGVLEVFSLVDDKSTSSESLDEAANYGINLGAWTGMLANPGNFFGGRATAILEDPSESKALYDALAVLLGVGSFKLPKQVEVLEDVLVALELLEPTPGGWFSVPVSSWLSLVDNPRRYLENEVSAIFSDSDGRLKQLLTQLGALAGVESAYLSVDATGTVVTLTLPDLAIGAELFAYGSLGLDLKSFEFEVEVAAAARWKNVVGGQESDSVGAALLLQYKPQVGADFSLAGSPTLSLAAAPGPQPAAFEPLPLYPPPDPIGPYLARLGTEIPITVLSAVAVQALNRFVMPATADPSPARQLAGNIFKAFGLASQVAPDKPVQVKPLAAAFTHPIDWLLSPDVLGDGKGGIDLTNLGKILYAIPGAGITGPGNIELKAFSFQSQNNGLQLINLPYGVSFNVYSDETDGVGIETTIDESIQSGAVEVAITPGISFGHGAGVHVDGTISLSFALGASANGNGNQVSIEAGYNTKVAQGFDLTLSGQIADGSTVDKFGPYDLVPFTGLNQFLNGAGEAVLNLVGQKLFDELASYEGAHPDVDWVKFVKTIQSSTGLSSFSKLETFIQNLIADPLAPFESAQAPSTMRTLQKLLTGAPLGFDASTFPVDHGVISYKLPIGGTDAAITVSVGNQSMNGTDNVFGLWIVPTLEVEWLELSLASDGAQSGIGVVLPSPPATAASPPTVEYALLPKAAVDLSRFSVPALPGAPVLQLTLDGQVLPTPTVGQFSLQVYPAGEGSTPQTLVVDLLPTPRLAYGNGQSAASVGPWLEQLAFDLLIPLLADIALSLAAVRSFLNKDIVAGDDKSCLGSILSTWGLLDQTGSGDSAVYALADLRQAFPVSSLSDVEGIVFRLLAALADALAGHPLIPGVDIEIAERQSPANKDHTFYGLELSLPDIVVSKKPGSPKLVLQLGKWLDGETDDNWIHQSDPDFPKEGTSPGVAFYLLLVDESGSKRSYSFGPGVELISVGLDFDGADAQHPLVDVKGFSVGSIQPRVYGSFFDDGGQLEWALGGALLCDQIGVPLGPGFGNASGDNAVAQNILASGKTNQHGKDQGVNPAFSASFAYVYADGGQTSTVPVFQFYDPQGNPTDKVWIPIQRAFGPIQCSQLGLGWEAQPKIVDIGFDGSVELAGLAVELDQLMIGIPIRTPTDFGAYRLGLQGLEITYQGGSVDVSAGFLHLDSGYYGEARIQVEDFSISGLGGYDVLAHHPSLFIYAAVEAPLGDPTGTGAFFVTGVAAGFGYNRGLNLPDPENVATYPFVAAVESPGDYPPPPDNPSGYQAAMSELLTKLASAVPPQLGENWVAAGVKWTSFDLIDSFALLTVAFGTDFEIGLLGVSTIELPKSLKDDNDKDKLSPIIFSQLEIDVTYTEKSGILKAAAVINPASYVLDPDCHLQGGFAFYAWFKDQLPDPAKDGEAGQFVITLGGYHPDFVAPFRPPYYPNEPRVGFNWAVGGGVDIKGGLYFALTPAAVMAGGSLDLTFQSGALRAWFDAYADFLIMWKPFHYEADIGVSIGASYRVDALFIHHTFTIELGASLALWGPKFGGKAHVSWFIISFTIHFGDQSSRNARPPLDWQQFAESFLPAHKNGGGQSDLLSSGTNTLVATNDDAPSVITATVSKGLMSTPKVDGKPVWVINPQDFTLVTNAIIPSTGVSIAGHNVTPSFAPRTDFGVRPMQQFVGVESGHEILLSKENAQGQYEEKDWDWVSTHIVPTVTRKSAPMALWANTAASDKTFDDEQTIPDTMGGLCLEPKPVNADDYNPVGPFPKSRLAWDTIDPSAEFAWGKLEPSTSPQYPPPGVAAIDELMATVAAESIVAGRAGILEALVANGVAVSTDADLAVMAATADEFLLASPLLVSLGSKPNFKPTPGKEEG